MFRQKKSFKELDKSIKGLFNARIKLFKTQCGLYKLIMEYQPKNEKELAQLKDLIEAYEETETIFRESIENKKEIYGLTGVK